LCSSCKNEASSLLLFWQQVRKKLFDFFDAATKRLNLQWSLLDCVKWQFSIGREDARETTCEQAIFETLDLKQIN
jgi:hypothetical protein